MNNIRQYQFPLQKYMALTELQVKEIMSLKSLQICFCCVNISEKDESLLNGLKKNRKETRGCFTSC